MISTRSFMDQTWTDLNSPTREEVDSLILARNIDHTIAKDLLSPSPKQCLKESGKSIYAVLHIPTFRHSTDESVEQEIDFIIEEKFLITNRYDSIDALHYFAKQIEVSEILNKENHSHLFFGLMKEIYKSLFDEIDYMKDWMKDIDKKIFEGKEKQMVFGISAASRDLLNFKRIVDPHEIVWQNLVHIGREHFGIKFEKDAMALLEEWQRLDLDIKNIFDMLNELRETNNSILSTKQNELMKTFTILAFVTLPLSLVAAIFGMNAEHMPIIGQSNDFWIVLSIMICVSLAMFIYFKYKKWI